MSNLCVIFDMDGVLLDTETTVTSAWVQSASSMGIDTELMRQASIDVIGMNLKRTKELFEKRFSHIPGFDFDKIRAIERDCFLEFVKSGIPTKPGAKEILSWLHKNNATIGLATSTYLENVTEELKAADLFDYFDEMVCGDMVTNGKPHPEIYLKCADKLGIDIHDAYVIEDSYNGIKSAHRAGAHVIMVPDCLPPTEETESMCIKTLKSLVDVKNFLAGL